MQRLALLLVVAASLASPAAVAADMAVKASGGVGAAIALGCGHNRRADVGL